MSNLDFAALLCSRLCHDLVSPVGAINNGLEILAEEKDPSMRDAVVDLIEKSTQQTANKLQFFRLAFGAAGGFSSQLDLREAEKAVTALLTGSRVTLDWQVEEQSASKSVVKLLLNVCLAVSETLIRGGTMTVKLAVVNGKLELDVTAKGERVLLQAPVKDALEGNLAEDDMEPRTAPAILAETIAKELATRLVVTSGEGSLNITASEISNG